jgi:hypothetical protein
MATPAQIRSAVDTKLAALWAAVQSREDTYFANHGRYWQGLKTHTVIPADGATATPDIGSAVPYYQAAGDAWPSGILTQSLPMSLDITQYQGPTGSGYVATVSVLITGHLWQRAQDSGAESYRTFSWTDMGVPA